MRKKNTDKDNCSGCLQFESVFDDALDMAQTLKKIDTELNMAAMCEGDYPGGYPSENLLPALCKIMYASQRAWMRPRYDIRRKDMKENEDKN